MQSAEIFPNLAFLGNKVYNLVNNMLMHLSS